MGLFTWSILYYLWILMVNSQELQYNLSASKTLNAATNFAIDVQILPSKGKVEINMTGPSDLWFGVGFGGTDMPNTYAIVCSGNSTIEEHKLSSGSPGETLEPMINITLDISRNGIRTVSVLRDIEIKSSSDYFTFPTTPTIIDIIDAYGKQLFFNSSSHMGFANTTQLTFKDGLTNKLTVNQDLTLGNVYMAVNISIYPDEDIVQINFTGPNNAWSIFVYIYTVFKTIIMYKYILTKKVRNRIW